MELDNYVGNTVLLNLTKEFSRENQPLFQSGPRARLLYAKVVAHDELGIWVENPAWKSRPVRGGERVSHRANILVPWRSVISVAIFPGRKFPSDGRPEENTRVMGFRGK